MDISRPLEQTDPQANGLNRFQIWAGFLGGPIAWTFQLCINYALVTWACHHQQLWPLHLVNVLCALAAIAAGLLAWRTKHELIGSDMLASERSRFLGTVGLLSSAFFFLLIIVESIPVMVFDPCRV